MDKILKSIASEYIEDVNTACQIMLAGFGISSRQQLMELRQYNQTGEFEYKGKQQFFFHGRGCRLINNQIEIDWDFGIEDNWCGIDPWKLYYYIKKNNKPYSEFSNAEDIENELIKACDCGEMKKVVGLYYFAHMLNEHVTIKTITNTEGNTEWSENNEGRRHGQYAEWHDNGQLRCLEEYSNGKINGKVQRWDKSGNKFFEGHYIDGLAEGKFIMWSGAGNKSSEGFCKNGKRHGKWFFWNKNGKKEAEVTFDDGNPIEQQEF